MANEWSVESFCSQQSLNAVAAGSLHPKSALFLAKLDLSSSHPLCEGNLTYFAQGGAPPIGPADINFYQLHNGSSWGVLVTYCYMFMPPILALCALWAFLIATIVAPVGFLVLVTFAFQDGSPSLLGAPVPSPVLILTTVLSSLVIRFDKLYLHDFKSSYGTILFALSSFLSLRTCKRYRMWRVGGTVSSLVILTLMLTLASNSESAAEKGIDEGLYYDIRNPTIRRVVSLWDPTTRTYSTDKATPWMVTGDARTGLPFILNTVDYRPNWVRMWLPTKTSPDPDVIALDISFPRTGHDAGKPVYLVLHGLNGGSSEQYVLDLAKRRNQEGSTVVVMIARGMMDTPIRSWGLFHGARVHDAHDAATALRRALTSNQLLVGVGYSMGAIVLNNYVAEAGSACALDAAFTISGALDCRYELHDTRSKMLWQPMLAESLKSRFLLGKYGKKVQARLSNAELIALMRANNVVDVDRYAATAYHGFESVESFYAAMSALGDIPQEDYCHNHTARLSRKISNVSLPLCVMHALDDPISTWKTVAATSGFMRPERLVRTGTGNLMILLTKRGGHVGWPQGWLSHRWQWEFMSEAVAGFANAVGKAKQERQIGEHYS